MRHTRFVFIFIFVIMLMPVRAQLPAFPGAEGFGKFTTGGRAGKVLIVSNLDDRQEKPLKGSLRWAVEQKGPRTIVFAISGTIGLTAPLYIDNGDITLAGQTAPGDGICIKNFVVRVRSNNVIIRYLRFRCGNEGAENDSQDAITGTRQENIIIDHCSASWSIDEAASFYDNKNFTMQWCILSESLNHSGHPKGEHGYGGIWGGIGASFHHNILSCHTSRNPRFNGARFTTDSVHELMDFRNNVIFNWGFQSGYGGEEGRQNVVNNYYKPGPATRPGEVQHRILELTQLFYIKSINPDTLHAGKFYIHGNYMEGSPETTNDNWSLGVQGATPEQKAWSRMDNPFPFAPVETQDAVKAYTLVLEHAGAVLPIRDAVDTRIIAEIKSGKCAFGGLWGKNTGIIDSQKDVGGWPALKSSPAPKDKDQDGMPDEWEINNHLNPNDSSDANVKNPNSDYTNIEVYINSLGK